MRINSQEFVETSEQHMGDGEFRGDHESRRETKRARGTHVGHHIVVFRSQMIDESLLGFSVEYLSQPSIQKRKEAIG